MYVIARPIWVLDKFNQILYFMFYMKNGVHEVNYAATKIE